MPGKDPSQYSLDEVCLFVNAVGLGAKADAFRENSVDGSMLVTLGPEDFGELGLTSLQGKKILRSLEFTAELAKEGGGGGNPAELDALSKENKALRDENMALKAQLAEYTSSRSPAPAPAPKAARAPAPSHHSAGAPVVRGAAGGAARGAVLGAVAGAIAGDPGQGAKMGAALGGTAGAMGGMGARRRARMRGF